MPKGLLFLLLLAMTLGLAACVSPQRESDLEWQKYNPNYRPLYPDQTGREWGGWCW